MDSIQANIKETGSTSKATEKLRTLKYNLECLSILMHGIVKFSFYLTAFVIIFSIFSKQLLSVYQKGVSSGMLDITGLQKELSFYLSEPNSEVSVYEYSENDGEKHFGKLLPSELLLNEENESSEKRKENESKSNLFGGSRKGRSNLVRDARYEEAVMAVKKARKLAASGNKKLATKLYQHALALEPEFADGLNMYGEFLEDDNNIMQADLLYQRALSYEPSHMTALANRERTMPLVEELDKIMLTEIDKKKSELYTHSPQNAGLRKAMKEFYYQHIYHTVSLEGNTFTIDEIREVINSRRAIAGKSVYEHSEIVGVDEALKYLNNTLLLSIGSITVEHIKEIHKRVTGFVDPVNAGIFRNSQVYVGKHIPPHPNLLPQYMGEFNNWLNSKEARQMHPVEFAALAHYKLVYVHPFIDGNGRTSRLLMNFILMRNGFPPVSIQVNDRWEYYEALEAANEGDARPFIRFISKCVSFTLDDYLYAAQDLTSFPELQGQLDSSKIIEPRQDER